MAELTQQNVIDYIKGISVIELSQLVKALESELGVSAAAAMPMMMPGMAAGGAAAAAAVEEKTEFTVTLTDIGPDKIKVIKVVRVKVIEPLFPCYLFVRCELGQLVDEVRYVTGISSLVRFNDKIPAVPDHVVEELRQCFESEEPMLVQDRLFPGAEVTVSDGVFLGARGIVVRVLPAKQRVQILLDFMGRSIAAELSLGVLLFSRRDAASLVLEESEAISRLGAHFSVSALSSEFLRPSDVDASLQASAT